jgi:hypothetical protein
MKQGARKKEGAQAVALVLSLLLASPRLPTNNQAERRLRLVVIDPP